MSRLYLLFGSLDSTAVPLTFKQIVWDELGVIYHDRMPHGCGIRAYMDDIHGSISVARGQEPGATVFTARHGK